MTVKDNDDAVNYTSMEIEIAQDANPPTVKITKPEKALYIFDRWIIPRIFRLTLIIGKITIEVNAKDEDSGIEKVEFYINDQLKGTDVVWASATTFYFNCVLYSGDNVRIYS